MTIYFLTSANKYCVSSGVETHVTFNWTPIGCTMEIKRQDFKENNELTLLGTLTSIVGELSRSDTVFVSPARQANDSAVNPC